MGRVALVFAAVVWACAGQVVGGADGQAGQAEAAAAGPPPSDIRVVQVVPTVFMKEKDGAVLQAIDIIVENAGPPASGRVEISLPTGAWSEDLADIPCGRGSFRVLVAPVSETSPGRCTLSIAGRASCEGDFTLEPERQWKIFVAPSVHTDIGYTVPQPDAMELHLGNIEVAMEAAEGDPGFVWNLETAWQARTFLENRSTEQGSRLLDLMRHGRIGLHGIYMNSLTGLMSHEELNRMCYYAAGLRRQQRVPLRTATLTDVPTSVGALPTVLARSGIEYFVGGINGYRAPFLMFNDIRSPFWWEGPDGSRVLAWFHAGYAAASAMGLTRGVDEVERKLPEIIRGHKRAQYPFDSILLYGAFTDNFAIAPGFEKTARAWNEKWAFPRIIVCREDQFFDHVKQVYGAEIPVRRGDGGAYWEDGAASAARETALVRRVQEVLPVAEALHSLGAGRSGYPAEELARAWDGLFWFTEHTWGSSRSVSQPESPGVAEQWRYKVEPLERAADSADRLFESGLMGLLSSIRVKRSAVAVFNPLSWTRSDIARVTLDGVPAGASVDMIDLATGGVAPAQRADPASALSREYMFTARDVPSLGYRLYEARLAREARPAGTALESGSVAGAGTAGIAGDPASPGLDLFMENAFFAVQFDPENGGVASIVDKRTERELLDPLEPCRANQWVYVSGKGGDQAVHTVESPEITFEPVDAAGDGAASHLGPVFGKARVKGRGWNVSEIRSDVVVYRDLPRIDFVNRVVKTLTYDTEAAFFAFPFQAKPPAFAFEGPDSIVNPADDMLPGGCVDWFAVRHFVDVSDATGGVTWACPDSALVTLGGMTVGKNNVQFRPASGAVYAYVMNNSWDTNYRAGQGGELTFRYSIASHPGGFDPVAAARFGWEAGNPLRAVVIAPSKGKGASPATASFLGIDQDNVVLLAFKRAEDGTAFVVRLWDVAGREVTAGVRFPGLTPVRAFLADMVEDPGKALSVKGDTVFVPVTARSVVTVRVEFKGAGKD